MAAHHGPIRGDELPDDSRTVTDEAIEDCDLIHFAGGCLGCKCSLQWTRPAPAHLGTHACCKDDCCPECQKKLGEGHVPPFNLATLAHGLVFCPVTPPRPMHLPKTLSASSQAQARDGRAKVRDKPPPLDLAAISSPPSPSKREDGAKAGMRSSASIEVGDMLKELSRAHSGRVGISNAAHMMAANAVVQDRWPNSKMMALLYRLTEFCANVICLWGSFWLLWYWVAIGLAMLLWYLPAAVRTRSLWKPIRLPLLNFVVDDFSLLGLHPMARPAVKMYAVCLLRVLVLIVVIPWFATSAALPDWLKRVLSNENAIHILFQGQELHGQRIPLESVQEWAMLMGIVLSMSALWVLLTVCLLVAAICCGSGPLAWRTDAALQREIESLAEEIDSANCHADWRACLLQMKRLRKEHPCLKLTTVGSTFGPAVGTLAHLVLDIASAYIFFSHGQRYPSSRVPDFSLGILTLVNFVFTLMHNCNAGKGNPLAMISAAKASFERGVLTDTYIKILYGDQGAHVLLTLAVNVFGIPFRADNPLKVASALMAIFTTVATCVPFIFQQFDLGSEQEGLELGAGQAKKLRLPMRSPDELAAEYAEAVAAQRREVLRRLF